MTEIRGSNIQLALDTILQKSTAGIPTAWCNVMEHAHIERLAGTAPGSYAENPEAVYLACQRAMGVCWLDQYIPANPLTLGEHGLMNKHRGATTGAEEVVVDGRRIDGPEAVASHLEEVVFPRLTAAIEDFDETARTQQIIASEAAIQAKLGPTILKTGYAFVSFPSLGYGTYGYANYLMAYALFPDVMERHFALQADLALRNNRAAAQAYIDGSLPPLYRLDHDMADSRGTLVSIESLDRIWFPHFARCIEPLVQAGVKLVWHCDGNLMAMVPRLIDAGVSGFQGFQYEDGMDYPRICAMKNRDGRDLIIVAGVSVSSTLPHGTPAAVRKELRWLVENGPRTGLFLGASSSICPGVPWENMRTFVDGLAYYRTART